VLNSFTTVDVGVFGVSGTLRGRPGFLFIDPDAADVLGAVIEGVTNVLVAVFEGVSVVAFLGCPLPLFAAIVLAAVVSGVAWMLTVGVDGVPAPFSTICTSSSSLAFSWHCESSGYFILYYFS